MKRFPGFGRREYQTGRRKRAIFAGAPTQPLDLVKPPDYELDETWREQTRADVARLIDSLKPGALDAGTREVVHNFINARVLRSLKQIESLRAERRAIARVLVGMADEEVARRKPGFDVDFAQASHATTATAIAFEELTGRSAAEYVPAAPARLGEGPLHSTVGRIDLHLDEAVASLDERFDVVPLTPGTAGPQRSPETDGLLDEDPDRLLSTDPDMPSSHREGHHHG
jgi:hypothetical protein